MTFDEILPTVREMLDEHKEFVNRLKWLLINRDLYGRVRLIAPETARKDDASRTALETLAVAMAEPLGAHAYPSASPILYEADRALACQGAATLPFEGHDNVWVVDRLATESN